MDNVTIWFLVLGGLLILTGAFHSTVKRLPLTTALIYLPIGFALGNSGLDTLDLDPFTNSRLLERISEIVVIISLFTAGLKLRTPLSHTNWRPAFRLATLAMVLTVAGIAAVSHFAFGFSLGAAILLGAVLAPTDPVLASDVQVTGPTDRDPLRFSLTAEAGLNDGSAFPFVLLGLGLLGFHDLGENLTKWFLVDVLWRVSAGLLVGAILGHGVAKAIHYLRDRNKESVVLDDFLTIGLICLSYGLALAIHSYGFLSVFAAGVALRRTERIHTTRISEDVGPDSKAPPAQMARAVLTFNEQLERLGEVITVVLVGAMLKASFFVQKEVWMIPILFLLIRPLSVVLALTGVKLPAGQRGFLSWFGIRGVGSIYYLSFAVSHGIPETTASPIISLVLATISVSILVHGISVTPLMDFYQEKIARVRRS